MTNRTSLSLDALLLIAVFLIGASACGVKAPPLPPESAIPQQSDKTGWSPMRGTAPSPSPSPQGK